MIEIGDNGEKLVDIRKKCPGIICDLGCAKLYKRKPLVRETVAEMLNRAKSYLPSGMTFIIGDAWRSKKLQKKTWLRRYRRLKKLHPKWSEAKLLEQTEKYVAPYEGREVSGHMTGGAIDLRLYKNGRKIPMKSGKVAFEENAKSDQKKLPKYIRRNRKLMFLALKKAGLSNYKKEYWHWSYGDLWWAKRNHKKSTIYGPVYKL